MDQERKKEIANAFRQTLRTFERKSDIKRNVHRSRREKKKGIEEIIIENEKIPGGTNLEEGTKLMCENLCLLMENLAELTSLNIEERWSKKQ